MVDFKSRIRDLINVSYGLNEEKPITNRSFVRKDLNIDSWSHLNETDYMNKSTSHFKRNSSKPSMLSGYGKSMSHVISPNNESKNKLFEGNNIILRKTPNYSELSIKTDVPVSRNRKHEFLQIKYSDLLGKKEENTKKAKTNKFMDLLLNEELTIKTNSNSVGLRDQKKSNTTTNKFMKELHFFSNTLKSNNNNKKVAFNKPAISVKSTLDAQSLLAFSPTARKSLAHSYTIIKTTFNEMNTNLISDKLNDLSSRIKKNGQKTNKLIMSSHIF